MYTLQPKKLLIINILEILRKYSDSEHRLSQKDIIELLHSQYQMTADRKAVKRNLMNLLDCGYNLEYSETVRVNKRGEAEVMYTDWYLEREFSDPELRLLIDSLLFSKRIPHRQCKELIAKIEGLSSQYFRARVKHICNLPEQQPENKQLFLTIEVLDEAISRKRQVDFLYGEFGTDRQLHPHVNNDGQPRRYLVNPYQMVATNGRYYLIGNYHKYDNIAHCRLDRILDARLLDSPVKPLAEVEGLQDGLDLPRHMAEHIYMFAGPSQLVRLYADRSMVKELLDWFGNEVQFVEEGGEQLLVQVRVNLEAMHFWALQYAPYVTVLSPQSLVDQLRDDLAVAAKHYREAGEE